MNKQKIAAKALDEYKKNEGFTEKTIENLDDAGLTFDTEMYHATEMVKDCLDGDYSCIKLSKLEPAINASIIDGLPGLFIWDGNEAIKTAKAILMGGEFYDNNEK